MAINNPYVPGDPFSYDLKWIIAKIKEHDTQLSTLSEQIHDEIIRLLDQHDPVYWPTAADLKSSEMQAPSLAYIEGFSAAGDGGAQLYYITSDYNDVLAADFYLTLDGANRWAVPVILTPYVTPEMFDVATNAADAFNYALRTGRQVIARGVYSLDDDIILFDNSVLDLRQANLDFTVALKSIRANGVTNVKILGGILTASNTSSTHKAIDVTGSDHVIIDGTVVDSFGGDAFYIEDSINVTVENTIVTNCYINYFAFNSSRVAFRNIKSYGGTFRYTVQFKSCQYSTIDGAYVSEGGQNAVYISTQSTGENPNPIINSYNVIKNCVIVDAGKNLSAIGSPAALLIDGENNIVSDIIIQNPYFDGFRTTTKNGVFSNITVENVVTNNYLGVNARSENSVYNNIVINKSAGYGFRIYKPGNTLSNIVLTDITNMGITLESGSDHTTMNGITLVCSTVAYNRGINISSDYVTLKNVSKIFDSALTPSRDIGGSIEQAHADVDPGIAVNTYLRGVTFTDTRFKVTDGVVTVYRGTTPSGTWQNGDTIDFTDKFTAGYDRAIWNSGAWHNELAIS